MSRSKLGGASLISLSSGRPSDLLISSSGRAGCAPAASFLQANALPALVRKECAEDGTRAQTDSRAEKGGGAGIHASGLLLRIRPHCRPPQIVVRRPDGW